MSLVIVRHGRTASNAAGLLLGRADPPLDDVGRAQVAAVAERIGHASLIVSSPLGRARETASMLAGACGIEGHAVAVDERWIELDYGDYEGVPFADVSPEVWDRWRADPLFTPPGGESLHALGERVAEACETLVDAARAGDVVVVTHVSPIKAALAWALGVGVEISWRTYVAPASITRIGFGPAGPSLRSFNECPWDND
jgi:probable phosphoglycerate mutase